MLGNWDNLFRNRLQKWGSGDSGTLPQGLQRAARQGANALEFALTLPVFVTITFGVLDLGWLYFQQSALDGAVHQGCRFGALQDPGSNNVNMNTILASTRDQILLAMSSGGTPCDGCSVSVSNLYASPALSLRCSVTNHYTSLVGIVDDFPFSSTAVMRMELQR